MALLANHRKVSICVAVALNALLLSSCGDGVVVGDARSVTDPLDVELRQRIATADITGDIEEGRNLPAITDPVAQLGKDLFFTTSLGGNFEVACVTCHHPNLAAVMTSRSLWVWEQ